MSKDCLKIFNIECVLPLNYIWRHYHVSRNFYQNRITLFAFFRMVKLVYILNYTFKKKNVVCTDQRYWSEKA